MIESSKEGGAIIGQGSYTHSGAHGFMEKAYNVFLLYLVTPADVALLLAGPKGGNVRQSGCRSVLATTGQMI